ncbi:hypothetical protein NKI98_27150 [Mesorhizobium sp. M0222]|uniref:hypothetical protein n=1 Tax=Mesorhizobium sp. M0222 TaxID=2956921 RepID=UPI00333C0CAA
MAMCLAIEENSYNILYCSEGVGRLINVAFTIAFLGGCDGYNAHRYRSRGRCHYDGHLAEVAEVHGETRHFSPEHGSIAQGDPSLTRTVEAPSASSARGQ